MITSPENKFLSRVPVLALVVGLTLLLVSGAAVFYLNIDEERAFRLVNRTISIQETARQFQSIVQRAVIGERGFLITLEPQYRDDYTKAVGESEDTVKELRNRRPDNLYKAIIETNEAKKLVRRPPSQKQVEAWVAEAKTLPPMVKY